MIHVIATVDVAPGRRADFLAEFNGIVPKVRTEAGCIEYAAAIDVPTGIAAQIAVRDDVVTIVEKWESLAALREHLVAPHMTEYRARVKPMVLKSSLQVLEPA